MRTVIPERHVEKETNRQMGTFRKVIQGGEKVPDRDVYLKGLKSNDFPGDFLMIVLRIVCNHSS
jgi:hypothetical protein